MAANITTDIYLPSSDAQIKEKLVFLRFALWQGGTVWCHVELGARDTSWAIIRTIDLVKSMFIGNFAMCQPSQLHACIVYKESALLNSMSSYSWLTFGVFIATSPSRVPNNIEWLQNLVNKHRPRGPLGPH